MSIRITKKEIPLKIKSFLSEKKLSGEQIKIWNDFLSFLDQEKINELGNLVTEDDSMFDVLTENLLSKKKAIENKDFSSLNKILKDEFDFTLQNKNL